MKTIKWVLEPTHSEVQFKARHMMISNVTGHFMKFDAEMATEGDDLTTAEVRFTADVNSISTNNEQRDKHLKSADFFDVANYPQITFESRGLETIIGNAYRLHGDLTINGITKAITVDVSYGGIVKDHMGNIRAGFTVEGKVSRKEFGLKWNALTETGGMVVGDEIKISANMEFIKSQEKGAELKEMREDMPVAA